MTYTAGSLIEAVDYNGFVSTNTGNVNGIWGAGTGDRGYGQSTTLSTVSPSGNVTATQWASLVNTVSTIANHQGTTITSRTVPTTGATISILSNLNTDLNTLLTNRGRASASGTAIGTFSGTTSKTADTSNGTQGSWTITFTHTVTFANATSARYFFNAGGLVKIMYGKSSTGTDHDPDWNTLAGQTGDIYFSGYVNGITNNIAGTNYTGTTRISGSGGTQTTLATTTGFYNLTPGGAATTIFQLNNATAAYTAEFIQTTVALNATSTVLTFVTTWFDNGTSAQGTTSNISGGTAVTSPATSIGAATAPTTLVNVIPPSTTYLTNVWGTPTIAASVA